MLTLYTPLDEPVAHTHWLGIAIQHARRLYAFDLDTEEAAEERACKIERLWWCCINRDRSIAVGLRRPLQVPASAVRSTPLLELDGTFGLDCSSSSLYTPSARRNLIRAFNRYCTFSVTISDALEILYPFWEPFPSTRSWRLHWAERYERLHIEEQKLDKWFARSSGKISPEVDVSTASKGIFVLHKLTNMYYQ